MAECTVCTECGSENFEEFDGMFFCTLCHSQSQQLGVLEVQEEPSFPSTVPVTLTLRVKNIEATSSKSKTELKARPWDSVEAFTIVLRRQAQDLERLGAPSETKELLFALWKLYLSSISVAFCEPGAEPEYARQRDRLLKTIDDPLGVGFLHFLDEETDDLALLEVDSDENRSKKSSGKKRKCSKKGSGPCDWLRLRHTLALCYLALLYTTPAASLVDLIRWVDSGLLTYRRSHRFLHSDMLKQSRDLWMLTGDKTPSVGSMLHLCASLWSLLELPELPPPLNLKLIAHRCVARLRLPAVFHGLLEQLYAVHMPKSQVIDQTRKFLGLLNLELVVMATVLMLIKMLFGLDDLQEWRLSRRARQHGSAGERPPFVFEEWIAAHSRLSRYLEQKSRSTEDFIVKTTKVMEFMEPFERLANSGSELSSDQRDPTSTIPDFSICHLQYIQCEDVQRLLFSDYVLYPETALQPQSLPGSKLSKADAERSATKSTYTKTDKLRKEKRIVEREVATDASVQFSENDSAGKECISGNSQNLVKDSSSILASKKHSGSTANENSCCSEDDSELPLCTDASFLNQVHRSYRWLLDLAGRQLCCSSLAVHRALQCVEDVYLPRPTKSQSASVAGRNNLFRRRYFPDLGKKADCGNQENATFEDLSD